MLFTYDSPAADPDDSHGQTTHGGLVVWAQIDGQWVIDETYEVGEDPIRG